MSENMIFEAVDLTTCPRKKKAFRLEHISFSLPAGYIMGLVGKNGAGKSTFFRTIMGENSRYTGNLLLEGSTLRGNHVAAMEKIGFVSEDNEFLGARSLIQNGELLGPFYNGFDTERFRQTLTRFQLPLSRNIHDLSRGEMMKFQLAFAMAHHPRLYLIDEATAGMDPVFRMDFYRILRSLLEEESCSVILSTHIREEITRELDYVAVLENGKLVSFGENEWI